MAKDREAQLRNISAGYSEQIRVSDGKAIVAVLFVAIMLNVVVQYHDFYPWYLGLPVALAPFLFIFMNLLISVYPRYPRDGEDRFPVRRRVDPEDFGFLSAPTNRDVLAERCALLSRILWWKNTTLRIAYVTSMITMVVAAILLFVVAQLSTEAAPDSQNGRYDPSTGWTPDPIYGVAAPAGASGQR